MVQIWIKYHQLWLLQLYCKIYIENLLKMVKNCLFYSKIPADVIVTVSAQNKQGIVNSNKLHCTKIVQYLPTVVNEIFL